jgi:EAL domain-containing protein (putative c-di-GMP-specific phosphodiesterase class I)/GGDEF domain-containing protein
VQRALSYGESGAALMEAAPDLILLVRRDGVLLDYGGGADIARLRPPVGCIGKPVESVWTEAVAALIRQMVRKAIDLRAQSEVRFEESRLPYELRASARGPDRAVCVIRALTGSLLESTGEHWASHLDRRGFLRRLKESSAVSVLKEHPLAVAALHLDGLTDVAQTLATSLSEQILGTALLRLQALAAGGTEPTRWYFGQLSETLLGLVFASAERNVIERCVERVCACLREPILVDGTEFHLRPHAGVAILGQDASSSKTLLEHARTAAFEARRCESQQVHFFTETLRLKSIARHDFARELRGAIANRDIRLRYVGRYDLASGQLVCWVGYLHWEHPLRGQIRPAEFLRVAETTGQAITLSRAALACLRDDFPRLQSQGGPQACVSFGALRHHVLHAGFAANIEEFLEEGVVPRERLELRIAEKTLSAREPEYFNSLRRLNLRLVVDEVGRGLGSLDWLARGGLWGLQLDRAWVTAVCKEELARKVCRAGLAVASALGLTPIATGVDAAEQRNELLTLGCRYGSGDFYDRHER